MSLQVTKYNSSWRAWHKEVRTTSTGITSPIAATTRCRTCMPFQIIAKLCNTRACKYTSIQTVNKIQNKWKVQVINTQKDPLQTNTTRSMELQREEHSQQHISLSFQSFQWKLQLQLAYIFILTSYSWFPLIWRQHGHKGLVEFGWEAKLSKAK